MNKKLPFMRFIYILPSIQINTMTNVLTDFKEESEEEKLINRKKFEIFKILEIEKNEREIIFNFRYLDTKKQKKLNKFSQEKVFFLLLDNFSGKKDLPKELKPDLSSAAYLKIINIFSDYCSSNLSNQNE
jgi:hypothetical protein